MALTSLILGIVSLLISFIPNALSYVAFVSAIAGLALGIISLVKKKGKAKSIVGIVFNSIVILLVILAFVYLVLIEEIPETIETSQTDEQSNHTLCVNWEDFYRLEQKDDGTDITAIGIVNSIDFEELSDDKEYYRMRIELRMFDKDAYPHYIMVMYNRPYNSTKILEDDTIWVYGTYQYPSTINANNIEISR